MSTCLIPGNWEVVRITKIDACGRPVYGPCNAVVSKCIATITDEPEVEEAEPRTQTGFDGQPCATTVGCDRVTFHSLEITWSEISMDGFSIMNPGYRITRDSSGQAIGMFANNVIDCSSGYAIEVWASAMGESDVCTLQSGDCSEAQGQWYYRVYPWVTGATPGEVTMGGTDEVAFPMTGRTHANSRWGTGPYDITLLDGVPSGLPEAFDPDEDEPYWEGIVTLPPPEADCNCVDVDRPIPEPATLTITGNPEESPRCTVNLFADNNGLGPVMVDWGDGSPMQEVKELTTVSHRYAGCDAYSYGGNAVTLRVCDKQDPAVCTEKEIQLPLPPDEPDIAVTSAGTPEEPNRVTATVVLPPHANGGVKITWGDRRGDTEAEAGPSGVVEAQHVYCFPGRYRVCAERTELPRRKGCQVISVPMDYGYGSS